MDNKNVFTEEIRKCKVNSRTVVQKYAVKYTVIETPLNVRR